MSTSTSTSNSNSNSSVHIGQQLPACDSVEMRERPRVPPKPANLRAASTTPTTMSGAGTSSASPTHTHSLAAEAANALNAPAASDSPAPSLHTANAALNAAAATPRPPHSPAQPRPMAGSKGQAARKRTVDDFSFGRTLGEGSYSTVVEATEKATGRVFAAKILDKRHIIKEKKIKYVNIERDILQALHHPFIVRLHYAFQDSQSLYFIIDLAANGELLSWIRKLGGLAEESARFYLAEIIVAVEYMHMERTLHRDLKPENILLGSDMHILITDFGTAKMFSKDDAEQRANSFVGTAEYVSPELLTDKSADRNSDLWAVGCIAYQLLTGKPPFKGLNEYQTFQKILKLDYSFPSGMPALARDLVERILVLDPEKRLGATQRGGFKELKAHPFFSGFDWQSLSTRTPPAMASGGLQESAAGSAAGTGAANSRIAPPVIPPKPPMLRQPNSNNAAFGSGDISPGGLYDTRQSSSDGFSTEKTSDSFPTSPSASTDPLASAAAAGLPPNLHGYRINPPISPVQTPVHLGYAPPPPPPPHQYLQQQQQNSAFSSYSSAATSHMRNPQAHHPSAYHQLTSHSNETDIYNVRLNDHVPPPLKAEEMAVVNHLHSRENRYPVAPTTNDYYSAASYRPPGQHMHYNQQPVYNNYASSSNGRGSWASTFRAIICCGGSGSQR